MITAMPEVHVRLRWPDGSTRRCYSPSQVVTEHLEAGTSYPLHDFVARAHTALTEASDRVEALYGFPCGRAAASLDGIEREAARFAGTAEAQVVVEAFER
jgi:uncharacterized repeat protein (TIGR04042 family)